LHNFPAHGHDLTDSITANFVISKTAEFFYPAISKVPSRTAPALSLIAYPNPSRDRIYIALQGVSDLHYGQADALIYQITDAFGRCWSKGNWEDFHETLSIDLPTATPGVYFLKVSARDGRGAELRLVRCP
jgi:hypothetical protein